MFNILPSEPFNVSKSIIDPIFGTHHKRKLSSVPKYSYFKTISNIKSKYPKLSPSDQLILHPISTPNNKHKTSLHSPTS